MPGIPVSAKLPENRQRERRRHRDGTEPRTFLPSEGSLSRGGDSGQLGRWRVWVLMFNEVGGSFTHNSSQPFLYKVIYKGSMKIAVLFQYLIIMNLFNGTILSFFFFLILNQTVTTLLPKVFPALLKLSEITVPKFST